MNDEHPNIVNRDWRLQAITTLAEDFVSPYTGIAHKAGTPVEIAGFVKYQGQLLQMPIPNPGAVYLSLGQQAAEQARELLHGLQGKLVKRVDGTNALPSDCDRILFDALENLISCVIFAYTALEAFANESIPDDYKFERMRGDKKCTELYSKDQIERHLSLDTKLDEVLPVIRSVVTPKGTKTWEMYIWLKNLRDRFIHLKSSDWRKSAPESADEYVWTDLLSDQVLQAPSIALGIIEHYSLPDRPRWLKKIPFRAT